MISDPGAQGGSAMGGEGDRVPPAAARSHPGRLVLGFAVLTAERLRPGAPPSDTVILGVGLAQQAATEMRGLARRTLGRPARMASRTLDWASARSSMASQSGVLARPRARLRRLVDDAMRLGEATVAAGRADADALIRAGVADGVAWAQAQAVPQIVDGLVPHLVDSVVPRLIDGVMPEVRARVLPVVIDDLTNDPRLRDLVLEQSRGVVDEAAQHVRTATATADDRVESAFRRLVGRSAEVQASDEAASPPPPPHAPEPGDQAARPSPPVKDPRAANHDR